MNPQELSTWQQVRRWAVPPWMVERCTERRLAGDWRGACEAARIEVAFTDDEARGFEAELAALAPDLLRWHLPHVPQLREAFEPDETAERLLAEGEVVQAWAAAGVELEPGGKEEAIGRSPVHLRGCTRW